MKNFIERERKYRRISKFKKFKVKQEYQKEKEDLQDVPKKFKQVYEEIKEERNQGEGRGDEKQTREGGKMKKPKRFRKELEIQKVNLEEKERKFVDRKEKEKKKKQNKRERINTHKLLSKTNQKGQPRLKNVMKHVYGKLGINL
jgi:hypothetical protein